MLLATLVTLLPATWARAQSSSDLEAEGYVLSATTSVAGVFDGCTRNQRLDFADGTVFVCGEHYPHYAFEPRVEIYHSLDATGWAVAIDHRLYAGGLRRWRGQDLAIPRATTIGIGSAAPASIAASISPITGVLGTAQIQSLPPADPAGTTTTQSRRSLPAKQGYRGAS